MSDIRAEIEIDPQHGPIIRVQVNERVVSVYLMHETGTVMEPSGGQYGIEVKGPWWQFRQIYETEGRKLTVAPAPECEARARAALEGE